MLRKLDPTLKSLLGEKHLWEWGGEDSFKVAGNIGHIFGSMEWKKEGENFRHEQGQEMLSACTPRSRCHSPLFIGEDCLWSLGLSQIELGQDLLSPHLLY